MKDLDNATCKNILERTIHHLDDLLKDKRTIVCTIDDCRNLEKFYEKIQECMTLFDKYNSDSTDNNLQNYLECKKELAHLINSSSFDWEKFAKYYSTKIDALERAKLSHERLMRLTHEMQVLQTGELYDFSELKAKEIQAALIKILTCNEKRKISSSAQLSPTSQLHSKRAKGKTKNKKQKTKTKTKNKKQKTKTKTKNKKQKTKTKNKNKNKKQKQKTKNKNKKQKKREIKIK
jgi:endonuclease/exonuclease/phosphatase (EEP) superfamily protein YafD